MRLVIKKRRDDFLLQVVPVPPQPLPKTFFSLNYSLILFIITIITVTISGYFISQNFLTALTTLKSLGRNIDLYDGLPLVLTATYTISILSVLGLHELGHTFACRYHHIEASLPIFIPGIPLVTPGTFGAVIKQKSPALNRNQLFDVGFSGPFLGFVVCIVISLLGYSWSIPISQNELQYLGQGQIMILPLLFQRLSPYVFPNPSSYTHLLHPMALAGWITTFITFLNIFPIGQLDGGHISRALFGAKWHRRLSLVMLPVMVLAGWWQMALLLLLFFRGEHPGVLDETTKVTLSRKILSIFVIVIFLSCFTFSPESPILHLLFKW